MRESKQLNRIKRLAVPPAWRDVWICRDARGHLQATGIDARGRKQYRYHADWTVLRHERKFKTMPAFAKALPQLRRRIARDLRRRGMPREKVVAAIIALLDQAALRIGNDEYARDNGSFGLTTIRNSHASVRGKTIRLSFRGKGGQMCDATVTGRSLAAVVRRCQELPGQELFEYVDDRGMRHDIKSHDVNQYLQDVTGLPLTAKDFRTWWGSVTALSALRMEAARAMGSPKASAQCVRKAIAAASEALGNTLTVCRRFYVHPALQEPDILARLRSPARKRIGGRRRGQLSVDECMLMAMIAD